VEYTPQADVRSDLDMFTKEFLTGLEDVSSTLVSIDGGDFPKFFASEKD
jgi:tripeptidyl-peptidase-1